MLTHPHAFDVEFSLVPGSVRDFNIICNFPARDTMLVLDPDHPPALLWSVLISSISPFISVASSPRGLCLVTGSPANPKAHSSAYLLPLTSQDRYRD